MSLTKYLSWCKYTIKYTKNPIELGLFYFNQKDEVTCYLKDDFGSFELNQENKYKLGASLFTIDEIKESNDDTKKELFKKFIESYNEEYLDVDGVKFHGGKNELVLYEYFSPCPYYDDLNGRTVFDVGGNIGDTALFMAKEGATVYSFEPVPEIYQLAKKNIEINPDLKDKIHMFNYAIDDKDGEIELFMESMEKNPSISSFTKVGKKITVTSYSIESALKKFNIKPDILKMDCEGSEYNIVLNSDLSMFNRIILEYHEKFVGTPYNVLVERLEDMGFEVTVLKISQYKLNEFGFILAKK